MFNSYITVSRKPSDKRAVPFLPRLGVVVDLFGYELQAKYTPFAEIALEFIQGRIYTPAELVNIAERNLQSIQLAGKKTKKVVDATFRVVSGLTRGV